jgi:hypothetical protein
MLHLVVLVDAGQDVRPVGRYATVDSPDAARSS